MRCCRIDKKYQIIYADPPWEYRQSGSKTNSRGMAKQHYDTMSTTDLCNLQIPMHDEAICFMWATFPNIGEALTVMKSWGFEYKTAAFVWVKKNKKSSTNFWGMGAYTRANAEVCLLGITPKFKATQYIKAHNIHQIIESPIEKHSKKPDVVREKIIELCGDLPRVELFAREVFDGWDSFGNEVDGADIRDVMVAK